MTSTAGCFGKIAYATKAEAERARRHLYEQRGYGKKGGGRESTLVNAYHCRLCGKHHLGRDKRAGRGKDHKKTADHHAGSFKARKARYSELTET